METNNTAEEFEEIGGKKYPIVYVTRDKDTGFCKFMCRHCNEFHTHGRGDGLRSAHCKTQSNSPYLDTGYVIKTKPNGYSLIQDYKYIITLYNFKTNKKEIIKLSKYSNTQFDFSTAVNIIYAYEDRDYHKATYNSLLLFKKVSEEDKNWFLDDLQGEGDGVPDFVVSSRTLDHSKDFYVEFKSERDSLRMNQLFRFLDICNTHEVYILHIDKKLYTKNDEYY